MAFTSLNCSTALAESFVLQLAGMFAFMQPCLVKCSFDNFILLIYPRYSVAFTGVCR